MWGYPRPPTPPGVLCFIFRDRGPAGQPGGELITLATKSTGNLVFDAPARMVVRSENFLRDGARHHAPCCGKGQQIVLSAIFKAFSKNARIGDRSGYRAFRSRESVHKHFNGGSMGSRPPRGGKLNPYYHR